MKSRNMIVAMLTIKEINVSHRINAIEQSFDQSIVSANRDALILIIEIIIIKDKSNRQPINDKCRKLGTFPAPLFFSITFDQSLIDIFSYQCKRLFFKITWFVNTFSFHLRNRFRTLFF